MKTLLQNSQLHNDLGVAILIGKGPALVYDIYVIDAVKRFEVSLGNHLLHVLR